MAKRKFSYKKRSTESVEKRARGAGGGDYFLKDEFTMFSPSTGDNLLRIFPPTWDEAEHFGLDVHVHYGIGSDNATFLSLHKMKGEPDPIYEERLQATADGDEEYAKSLRPNGRVLVWLIDREKEDEGPKLWAMPYSLDKELALRCKDKKTGEILSIDDPDDGYDVEFTKTGTGIKTKYEGLQIARRSCRLHDDDDKYDEWLDYVVEHPLPSTLQYHPYDYIKKVFGSHTKPSPPKEEEEEEAKTGKRKSFPSTEDMLEMTVAELDELCETEGIDLFGDDYQGADEPVFAFVTDICGEKKIDPPEKPEEEEEEERSEKKTRLRSRRG